jgi:hypothetical protein
MLELNLLDVMFSGPSAGSPFEDENPHIMWQRDWGSRDFAVVTDNSLEDSCVDELRNKVAWLFESPNPKTGFAYKLRKQWKFRKYQAVFTYDKRLIECGSKFQLSTVGGSWIRAKDWQVYPKHLNLSVLASAKRDLPGHRLRHEIIDRFPDAFDGLFGRPHRFVEYKLDALKDYRYSLVIENQRLDYYFTEKLIDCFATGTVPVYWGCPGIDNFFNPDGLIQFREMDELPDILKKLSEEDYLQRLPAIKENLQRARDYRFPEKSLLDGITRNSTLTSLLHI